MQPDHNITRTCYIVAYSLGRLKSCVSASQVVNCCLQSFDAFHLGPSQAIAVTERNNPTKCTLRNAANMHLLLQHPNHRLAHLTLCCYTNDCILEYTVRLRIYAPTKPSFVHVFLFLSLQSIYSISGKEKIVSRFHY